MHIHTKQHASLYGTRAGDVQGRLGSSGSSRCACAYVGILLCSLVATSKPCRPSRHAHLWIRACLATLIQMHSWACTHLWLSLYLPTDVYRVQTWVVWVHQALNGAEGLSDAFSAAPTCKRRGHRAHSKVCDCMRMSARVSYGIALCFVRCSAQCGAAIAWLTLCSTQCTSPERQGLVRYVLRAAHTSVHLGLLCVFLHVPIACALLLCQQVSETQLGCRV